jgi:hypothetical protein
MWTTQQRYCTACAAAVLLGFVLLAFYIYPTSLTHLNPFGGENCTSYEQQRALSKQQQSNEALSVSKGGETGAERDTRNAGAAAPDQPSGQGDYYACRLAVYTRQLALFTGALAIATVILIGTGIYQGVHLGRAANAAKASADALPTLERAYVFIEIDPDFSRSIKSILDDHELKDEGLKDGVYTGATIKYQFVNHGKTPAIVKAMSAEFHHWTELPEEIRYINDSMIGEIVIRSGDIWPPAKEETKKAILIDSGVTGVPDFYFFQKQLYLLDPTWTAGRDFAIENGRNAGG